MPCIRSGFPASLKLAAIAALGTLTIGHVPSSAQTARKATGKPRVTVPFVGCRSDGQAGPLEAPKGTPHAVEMERSAAANLAWYEAAINIGVLAPRGWHCFRTYGSGGDTLYVTPSPLVEKNPFSHEKLTGDAIQVSIRYGGTSGSISVAAVAARAFPSRRKFVAGVLSGFDLPADHFGAAPYPTDILKYKGETVVEYRTPPNALGLGTHSQLAANGSPIDGVAMLLGEEPNLWHLAVRLPSSFRHLAPAITAEFERAASRQGWR